MVKLGGMIRMGVLVMLPIFCFSQRNLDSLYSIWENERLADTTRANAFLEYIEEGPFHTNPDSAILLTNRLLEFADNIGRKEITAEALNLKGYTLFRIGNYDKALETYKIGVEISEKIGYTKEAADILMRTGYIYHDNEDFIQAIEYYERSLVLFEDINDLDGIAGIYNEYGSIYRNTKDFDKSLEYYQKALDIYDKLNDEESKSPMYSNVGNLYLNKKKPDVALHYLEKALKIDQSIDDKLAIASTLGAMGDAYLQKKEYDKALELLENSLELSQEINFVTGEVNDYLDLAEIYFVKKEFAKSIELTQKSLSKAKQLGALGYQEEAHELLYESYRALGDVRKALESHENMIAMGDSIEKERTVLKMQQLEFSKQLLADSLAQIEKDLRIQMQHEKEVREKDRNRNIFIGIGILMLLLAASFYGRWRYVKKAKTIIEKEKNRSENLLLNILPAEIAEELKEKGEAEARDFELVSMLFTDFKGFTQQSAKVSAIELIGELNACFKGFDLICEKYGIEKIKTIGDAYMAAGGLPTPSKNATERTILAALEMQEFMHSRIAEKNAKDKLTFKMRVGIHSGPVVAGIVGVKKFQYDVWGDTVNTAARMESNGEVGKVNISQQTYELVKDNPRFSFEFRGKMQAKGKGEIGMWFVEKA